MNPRGRMAGVGGEKGIGGATTKAILPGFVVTLRAEKPKLVKDFLDYCRYLGVVATELQGDTYASPEKGIPCFYEIVGGNFLRQLKASRHRAVVERNFILDVRVPNARNTSWDGHSRCPGDASVRVRRECRVRNLPLSAQNELDRREMWTQEEHDRAAFAAAAELPH